MGYTPLATSISGTTDRSARTAGPLNMVILHHGATTSLQQIVDMMQPGGRKVSAHCAVKDKQIVATVDENYRAWSLSDAYWDSRSFTVECANESTAGWTISDDSHESLARLTADWAKRYNFPIIRSGDPKTWTLIGHGEVYTIHGGSYATACPGGMNLDWIANRANQILTPTKARKPTMTTFYATPTLTAADVTALSAPIKSLAAAQGVAITAGTVLFALCGDSPNTSANVLFINSAAGQGLANTLSAIHGGTVVLGVATFNLWVGNYSIGTSGGPGGLTAAQNTMLMTTLPTAVDAVPTNFELSQALTSTVNLVNAQAATNRDLILDAIDDIPSGGGSASSYALSLDVSAVPGTATGTATPA